MLITNKAISRRAVLKGVGVTVALPLLEAMVPARTIFAQGASAKKLRFVAIEMVHGAAGSAPIGAQNHLWSPAATGNAFDLSPSSLAPLVSKTTAPPSSRLATAKKKRAASMKKASPALSSAIRKPQSAPSASSKAPASTAWKIPTAAVCPA